ncbi:hypothetical protein PINS_up002876 [Pythium insidiosum]|nr:hypothetical protein PINS_up002876 [Pythium insidiosum]
MRRVLESCAAFKLPSGMQTERIRWLYDGLATASSPTSATQRYLLYWMQTSVRSKYNYSLEYAIAAANALELPLHVVYMLSDRSVVDGSYAPRDLNAFGFRNRTACQVLHHRHEHGPEFSGIPFWSDTDSDDEQLRASPRDPKARPSRSDLLDICARNAALVITDRPYLRPWRDALAECVNAAKAKRRTWGLVQVESDVVVPAETASPKEEYAARTIRPKIHAQLKRFLVELTPQEVTEAVQTRECPLQFEDPSVHVLDVSDPDDVLGRLDLDRSVPGTTAFRGGEDVAVELAKSFLETKLVRYATDRNEPSGDGGSNLSLYLRFGHISPVRLALNANKVKNAKEGKDSFLEELIVRRELAVNMCVYNDQYDTMACLPEYATITLEVHAKDKREHLYTVEQLEAGKTYDVYWNAAQLEMVYTGKMHGYMRMYWAKKILEWTKTPELGFRIALYLNNKYALDAPDPNSYTGIAWSFGKHDQGWKERPIFGKVRYMNEAGLKRKFRMDAYVAKVKRLQASAGWTVGDGNDTNQAKNLDAPVARKKNKSIGEENAREDIDVTAPPKKRKTATNSGGKKKL